MAESVRALAGDESRTEERILLDQVGRIGRAPKGYFAVHVHLSQLRAQYRQPHYLRIAARAFDTLTNTTDTTLYKLDNADVVLICHNVPVDDVDPSILKLRTLFSEDPLTFGPEGSLDDRFTTWYDLSQAADYASFVAAAETLSEQAAARRRQQRASRESADPTMLGEPLTPANLMAVGARVQSARVDDLVRHQLAIEVRPGAKAQVLFREHFVSMTELKKRVAPDINLFANPWLFLYLTETVDRRMLALLSQTDFAARTEALSINLNTSTVLSTGFQNFHERAREHSAKVVIELQTIDVFADLGAYTSARDWLRAHGYRVLIDALNPLALQFFDPGQLEADFVKINWSHEFLAGVTDDRLGTMKDVIRHLGRERVILARAESEDALKWALTLGISRFQGRFIDRLVEAMATRGKL